GVGAQRLGGRSLAPVSGGDRRAGRDLDRRRPSRSPADRRLARGPRRQPEEALAELLQTLEELRRELPREGRLGPPREADREVVRDLDLELAPVQLDGELAGGALEMRRHRSPRRTGPRGERLADAALEDARSHSVAIGLKEAHVGPVREELRALDRRAERGQ